MLNSLPNSRLLFKRRERERALGAAAEINRRGLAVRLPLPETHAGQAAALVDGRRYRVLCCGRRWRKSTTGLIRLVRSAERAPGGLFWWVWPSYTVGQVGWDMLRQACAPYLPGENISEARRRVRLENGAEIWIKSADHEDSLRAAGLDGVVFDECRDIAERTWTEIIRPAIMDRRGWGMFLSTPRGFDWFFRLYQKGVGGLEREWESWRFGTPDNPAILAEEIEQARAEMPDRLFRQEILAEFVESAGGVFRGVRDCIRGAPGDWRAEHGPVVIGADWAKLEDFTVFVALDAASKSVVAFDRMNRVDYILQAHRLAEMAKRWQARHVVVETNAAGEPVVEMLTRLGVPVLPFTTTAASKPPLIESLALAIERGEIGYPDIPELVGELLAYEVRLSGTTNRPVYGAPGGTHDDSVMALALAWWGGQRVGAPAGVLAAANAPGRSRFTEGGLSGGRWRRN